MFLAYFGGSSHTFSARVRISRVNMDVSKNTGNPKWMVYNGKPHEQMDDLGGPWKHPYMV